jgi:hypothetical protein
MKKALVINELKTNAAVGGCNFFNTPDPIALFRIDKELKEKIVSERLTSMGSEGYELETERILSYNVIDFNDPLNNSKKFGQSFQPSQNSLHGVYVFQQSSKANDYKVYLGPLIVLPIKSDGCGSMGCKDLMDFKALGCKNEKKSDVKMGCNNQKKQSPQGCNSPKVSGDQYINFFDDSKNSKSVQAINKHNGWRTKYDQEKDDFLFSAFVSPNELIAENWELINKQVEKDLESLYAKNFGFVRNVNLPSNESNYTEGLLFSNSSKTKIEVKNTKSLSVFLNAFEIMYLKSTESPWMKLFESPIITAIIALIKSLFGMKHNVVDKTTLTSQNIEQLQNVYNQNLANQSANLSKIDVLNNKILGKMRVTFAIPESKTKKEMGLLSMLNSSKRTYKLLTVEVDLSEKEKFNLDKF